MSHEVESLFYIESEGTPWHGLGVPVNEPLTSKEAIITAGLNWQVEKRPLFAWDSVKKGNPKNVQSLAWRVYRGAGLTGFARVDVMLDKRKRPFVLL